MQKVGLAIYIPSRVPSSDKKKHRVPTLDSMSINESKGTKAVDPMDHDHPAAPPLVTVELRFPRIR